MASPTSVIERVCNLSFELSRAVKESKETGDVVVFYLPSASNAEFNDEKQRIEFQTQRPRVSRLILRPRTVFAGLFFQILRCVLAALHDASLLTRRDLFYWTRRLCATQQRCNRMLQVVCDILGVSAIELHVRASLKGVIEGPLIYDISTSTGVLQTVSCLELCCIPLFPNKILRIYPSYQAVVLAESDATLSRLAAYSGKHLVLYVSGQGSPSISARQFVHLLVEAQPTIPIGWVGDADVGAVKIFLEYKYGSLVMCRQPQLATPQLRMIGPCISDILQHPQLLALCQKLTASDLASIERLLSAQYVQNDLQAKSALQALHKHGVKAQIAVLNQIGLKCLFLWVESQVAALVASTPSSSSSASSSEAASSLPGSFLSAAGASTSSESTTPSATFPSVSLSVPAPARNSNTSTSSSSRPVPFTTADVDAVCLALDHLSAQYLIDAQLYDENAEVDGDDFEYEEEQDSESEKNARMEIGVEDADQAAEVIIDESRTRVLSREQHNFLLQRDVQRLQVVPTYVVSNLNSSAWFWHCAKHPEDIPGALSAALGRMKSEPSDSAHGFASPVAGSISASSISASLPTASLSSGSMPSLPPAQIKSEPSDSSEDVAMAVLSPTTSSSGLLAPAVDNPFHAVVVKLENRLSQLTSEVARLKDREHQLQQIISRSQSQSDSDSDSDSDSA